VRALCALFHVTHAMLWNRGENIPTVALCCYYSPRIRAVDAVQHEHHTDVGHRDTGAHAVVYVRSHPVLAMLMHQQLLLLQQFSIDL
jgi:hypothetical protein